jgi:hypothetical protein
MITSSLFFATVVLVPLLLGLPTWRHHELRSLSLAGRLAATYMVGLVLAVTVSTLLSACGIEWRIELLLVTFLVVGAAVLLVHRTTQRDDQPLPKEPTESQSRGLALIAVLVFGSTYGAVACLATEATSVDYLLHWGVKGAHFALHRGIDFELLRHPFAAHIHVTYPPLWPSLLAWGSIAAGELPWFAGLWLTLTGLIAGAPLIRDLLRAHLHDRAATAVTALWFLAMSAGLVASSSAGNAAMPLLLFESVAVVAFLVETADGRISYRWLAAFALAGAVLTKNEGMVAACFILAGVLIRGLIWCQPRLLHRTAAVALPAALVFALWLITRQAHGLPIFDPVREQAFALTWEQPVTILKVFVRNLDAGTNGFSWLLPLTLLILGRSRQVSTILPGLSLTVGLLLFALFYYLHVVGDPTAVINWTLPRLSLPALSALILSVGVQNLRTSGTTEGGRSWTLPFLCRNP